MSNKLIPLEENGQIVAYLLDCPGCGMSHAPYARPHESPLSRASWDFNGDLEVPTFSPSILVKVESPYTGKPLICHFFIQNGYLRFLGDCTHFLAGKSVEMRDVDSPYLFEELEGQEIDVHC